MNQTHWVTSPYWFYGVSAVVVAYLLYMMFRKRKGLRKGHEELDHEL